MPDSKQVPFLIKLFDDESETVRATVLPKLLEFGESLWEHLEALDPPLDTTRQERLKEALEDERVRFEKANLVPFQPGQLVKHRRYGYRGVVVDYTEACEAKEEWYEKNQTQPDRDQPWYHVLVHDSVHVTYAAHSSLKADDSDEAVIHPWVTMFFDGPENGVYTRNDRPFPA
ncbi:MAG: heat shock protein HspQ [Planctomycetota bacterium]|nr:heat shock protein HspQ [Planctomycetota bacterium]